jgi:hypothetical protein
MPALIAALTSAQPENINMLSMTANMQRNFFSIRSPCEVGLASLFCEKILTVL